MTRLMHETLQSIKLLTSTRVRKPQMISCRSGVVKSSGRGEEVLYYANDKLYTLIYSYPYIWLDIILE
jgi:hypothetical protein